MIIDPTGVELIPGNGGQDCPGDGRHIDQYGNPVECCCDECNYYLCCVPYEHSKALGWPEACKTCRDPDCPHAGGVWNPLGVAQTDKPSP